MGATVSLDVLRVGERPDKQVSILFVLRDIMMKTRENDETFWIGLVVFL